MGISPNAKTFLNNNAELIKNVDFKTIYGPDLLGKWTRDPNLISEISQIFIKSGINPLIYLDRVPRYFLYGAEISSIEIPNNVKKIEDNAFFDSDIVTIEIPDSVIEIGENAFYSCDKLKSILFPNKLKVIPRKVCFICKSLEHVNMPDGIERIEAGAFHVCPKLQDLVLPKTLTEIEDNALPEYIKEIKFRGTKEQWKKIDINIENPVFKPLNPTVIRCIDGDIVSKNLKWVEM